MINLNSLLRCCGGKNIAPKVCVDRLNMIILHYKITSTSIDHKFETLGYHGRSQGSGYKFLLSNLEASYKWVNWKFALRCNNIGNVQQFESFYITALQHSHTVQQIRGTSVLFTASLSFR